MGIDPRPVFEYDQVLTMHDLVSIRNVVIYQYQNTPTWRLFKRYSFYVRIGILNSLIFWIHNNKMIKRGGGKNGFDKTI